jgi:hypothetical protein
MRFMIQRVWTSGAEQIAEGDTGLGTLSGRWRSKFPAEVGDDHDVELTLPDPTSLRVLAAPEDQRPGVDAIALEHVRFRGRCELVYDDGIIVVRLATNWSELVDPGTCACRVGDWVEFAVPGAAVEIYPIGG